MNRTALLFAVLPLACTIPARPEATDSKSAYETIRTCPAFCGTAVGFAGTTPKVVTAFRALTKQPDAARLFERLLDEATMEGQLYALCGLYHADHARFLKRVEPYRKSEKEVSTVDGCIAVRQKAKDVVESSAPGAVRLKNQAQTTREWAAESGAKAIYFDIVGGGWPNEFWERSGYSGAVRK